MSIVVAVVAEDQIIIGAEVYKVRNDELDQLRQETDNRLSNVTSTIVAPFSFS
jgi:hypothetical protein